MPRLTSDTLKSFRPERPKDIAPPPFEPSKEQVDIITLTRTDGAGNFIIEAVAGSGKTTTLVEVCKHLDGYAAFAAFNKKIAVEIEFKLSRAGIDGSRVKAGTFHSFGFQAWRRIAPNVKVAANKMDQVMERVGVPYHSRGFVKKLVSFGKQALLTGEEEMEQWQSLADWHDLEDMLISEDMPATLEELLRNGIEQSIICLHESNDLIHEIIDFDDMMYCPLIFGANFQKNDWVLIDEAQDTNVARRRLAGEMLRPDGRLIAVGDRRQAIYGFTGANADALDLIAKDFQCKRLPLSMTFRCGKNIVRAAQVYAPEIKAFDANPDGLVRDISGEEFKKITPDPTDAILCRLTRPLIELAFDFLRRGIACHVEGRDIGQNLITLVKKWRSVRTAGDLKERLEGYLAKELERVKGKEDKIATLEDKVSTLLVIIDSLPEDASVYEVEKTINNLFLDTDGTQKVTTTLSTVHKSKGREWDRVYIFGRNKFMPLKYAKQPWQLEQEANLVYVAITRAKQELINVNFAG